MAMAVSASAEPEYGTLQSGDPFTNFVGEKTAATIDFRDKLYKNRASGKIDSQ